MKRIVEMSEDMYDINGNNFANAEGRRVAWAKATSSTWFTVRLDDGRDWVFEKDRDEDEIDLEGNIIVPAGPPRRVIDVFVEGKFIGVKLDDGRVWYSEAE